jgi:hypothetical protein
MGPHILLYRVNPFTTFSYILKNPSLYLSSF